MRIVTSGMVDVIRSWMMGSLPASNKKNLEGEANFSKFVKVREREKDAEVIATKD